MSHQSCNNNCNASQWENSLEGCRVIVQCIGAILASALLLTIMTGLPEYEIAPGNLGVNGYGADYLEGILWHQHLSLKLL